MISRSVVSQHGKEAVVAIQGPDEFFGEGCLAGQALRIATATTISPDSEIMRIEKPAIVRALREETFTELFVAHLLARTIQVPSSLLGVVLSDQKNHEQIKQRLTRCTRKNPRKLNAPFAREIPGGVT